MLITFSLVANVVAPIGTIMAERLLYLPSLGFCLLTATLLMKVWDLGQRRLSVLACTMTLLCFMGRTWVRNTDWRDSETLFRSAVVAYPKSAKAHQGLGEALKKRGDCIGALDEYALALARYPNYVAAHYIHGCVLWRVATVCKGHRGLPAHGGIAPQTRAGLAEFRRGPLCARRSGKCGRGLRQGDRDTAGLRRSLGESGAYAPCYRRARRGDRSVS